MIVARARPRRSGGLTDPKLAFWLVVPAGILLAVLQFYPLLHAVRDSFFTTNLLTSKQTWAGLTNFAAVFSSPDVREALVRTLVYIVACIAIQAVMGVVTALLLDADLWGRTIARGLNLLPYMIPAIVTAIAFRVTFNDLFGIVNYVLLAAHLVREPVPFFSDPRTIMFTVVIVSCWKYTPFMVLALLARLQTLPRDLIEAATIDGAGPVRIFTAVTLPWILPVLLVTMLLRSIWMGTEFDTPYLIAYGGPLHASTLVSMQIRSLYVDQLQVGQASALAVGVAILLAIASIVYFRRYAAAEQMGA